MRRSLQPAQGAANTSLDLTIKFTRPATNVSGLLRCEGRVVSMGRRTATAGAEITPIPPPAPSPAASS
ncbi:hotdog domain-containing protein [Aeromicrobium sp. HA]|uniref:hotdog domain-containing protein n=1 Tax=Aeromicrobium sp. HA TaxID=3009077 RepID=UPI003FA4BB0A